MGRHDTFIQARDAQAYARQNSSFFLEQKEQKTFLTSVATGRIFWSFFQKRPLALAL
jgi:hypothetical protein